MESLDELSKTGGKPSFVKHVFNFNDESKSEMLNIIQFLASQQFSCTNIWGAR